MAGGPKRRTATSRAAPRCPNGWPSTCATAPTTIYLTLEVPDGVAPSGTLLALGCALGGWSFHVFDGRLRYLHNLHGQRLYEVVADTNLDAGRHEVAFRFEKDDGLGGQATLVQDGVVVGTGPVKRFTPVAFNELMIGLTCGYEWGPAIGGDYGAPFAFNGTIVRAEVRATGPIIRDPVAEVAAIWPLSDELRLRRPENSSERPAIVLGGLVDDTPGPTGPRSPGSSSRRAR